MLLLLRSYIGLCNSSYPVYKFLFSLSSCDCDSGIGYVYVSNVEPDNLSFEEVIIGKWKLEIDFPFIYCLSPDITKSKINKSRK